MADAGPAAWRVAGRRGRSTPAAAMGERVGKGRLRRRCRPRCSSRRPIDVTHAGDADDDIGDDGCAPARRPAGLPRRGRGPRTPAQVAADAEAAVRVAMADVEASPLWRRLRARLHEAAADADEAGGGKGAPWAWGDVSEVVVLGLGEGGKGGNGRGGRRAARATLPPSPSGSLEAAHAPRHQAALALLLVQRCPRPGGAPPPRLTAADPAFTRADESALAALGASVLPWPAAVARVGDAVAAGTPVLAYLPHCVPGVQEAVLAAAWTPAALPRLALLGNALSTLASRWDSGPPGTRAGGHGGETPAKGLALAALAGARAGAVVEASLAGPAPAAGDAFGAAFNDTALVVVGGWDESLDGV